VDSGLSLADLQKIKSSDKNIFERFAQIKLAPTVESKEVMTKSDGMTIDDESIVQKMTQFRGKSQKEGTIDVYW
jgi:hypothetical protein